MRKLDRSVIFTILSAIVTLALLVLANRAVSKPPAATLTATHALDHWASVAVATSGAEMRASEAESWVPAEAGEKLGTGAQVRTDEQAILRLNFERGAVVRLGPYTTLTIMDLPAAPDDPLGRLQLVGGKIWVSLRGGGMEVQTRGGSAAVRGSFAEFEYRPGAAGDGSDDAMVVRCLEGLCAAQSHTEPLIILGNLEAVMLTFKGKPHEHAMLGPDAVDAFVVNNPDSAGLVPTLTAGAPLTAATQVASDTPLPFSPTRLASATATATATATITSSLMLSPTAPSPITVTVTLSRTRTPTRTPTRSLVPSYRTATPRATYTPFVWWTPIPYRTWTKSPTPAISSTSTATATPTPTATGTPTPTATQTLSMTLTATATATVSRTPTDTPTTTSTPTVTDTPTTTPTSTATPTATSTPGGNMVNTTADGADAAPGDGVCETATGNGVCTLRAAIQEANTPLGLHYIYLSPGTYQLTLAGPGEDAALAGDLDITGNVNIFGSGAGSTVIDGSGLGDRIFHVVLLTSMLQINGVTIQNGNLAIGDGGAIDNLGTLVVNDSVIANNTALAGQGGAVFSAAGSSATLNRVWVKGNVADKDGGLAAVGDATHAVTLDVNASALTANVAVTGSAALFSDYATSNLVNVTVSGNTSGTAPALMVGPGGGPLRLTNVTLASNYVGIAAASGSVVWAANTIFADNTSANCAGIVSSLGYNLDSAASCGLSGTGDQSNASAGLGALGSNGGSTPTHLLQSVSQARDAGDNARCPATDQRGVSRPQNVICDVGAVEYQPGLDGPP